MSGAIGNTDWPGADRSDDSGRPNTPELGSATRGDAVSVTVRRTTTPDTATLAAWNALVMRTEGTDVTQLSAWATIRALAGYTPTYLLAHHHNTLTGGALILRRRLAGLLTIGYLPYGPVIDPHTPHHNTTTTALIDALTAFATTQHLMFIQPPEHAHHISHALLHRGFRPSHAGIAPAGSYRLDLTPPLEHIRASFSKRLKSWTNRWETKGVTVRHGNHTDLPLLVALMAQTGQRQGFRPPPLNYVHTLYRELSTHGQAALFIGEVHGQPVSADIVTVCAGMVRGRLGGFSGHGETGKLSVPAAVRWHIIQWAKQAGHHYLDFGGLPEQMLTDMIDHNIHTNENWPNAQRSKLQFNGHPYRYPTPVELVQPTPLRAAYDYTTTHPRGIRLITTAKDILRGNRGHTNTANATFQ